MPKKKPGYLICCAVILILIWSQSGFVFLQVAHTVHYHQVRCDKKEGGKFRDTLIMSRSEYDKVTWIKDDEIRFGGKMFDVKRTLPLKDKIMLVGHYDTKDDGLFLAINSLFDQDKDVDKHNKTYRILMIEATIAHSCFEVNLHFPIALRIDGERPGTLYRVPFPDAALQPPELS